IETRESFSGAEKRGSQLPDQLAFRLGNLRFRKFNLSLGDLYPLSSFTSEFECLRDGDSESIFPFIREHRVPRTANIQRWVRPQPCLRQPVLRLPKLFACSLQALILR